ncbi:MAG TPA: tyrosine-type recombinase/integrase [Terriglobales bacterium]
MRHRRQSGTVVERNTCFLIKYYERDESGTPRQVAEKLCDKAPEYSIKRGKLRGRKLLKVYLSPALEQKRVEFMRNLGEVLAASAQQPQLITDFWNEVYLPITKKKCAETTVQCYLKIWNGCLEPHFRGRKFAEYEITDATTFLTNLAERELKNGSREKGLGRNTLHHVKALASNLFRKARSRGLRAVDWRDAQIDTEVRAPKNMPHYTDEEVAVCLELLTPDLEGKAAFACACFLGLRTREVTRLQWEDVSDSEVLIRGTKTEGAVRTLPLIEPLRGILREWREKKGNPTSGWVFENRYGDGPKSTAAFMGQRFQPLLGKLWKGLYAGRRGASTEMWRRTKDLQVPAQLMGHDNTTTAQKHYTKFDPEALNRAMKLREAAFEKLTTEKPTVQ